MLSSVLFSSATGDWETPEALFQRLNQEFQFSLDVCASVANHKVARYFDLETDGLKQSWANAVWWCNPPYGRTIGQWTKKAAAEAPHSTGVMLLPSRTDTKWFHEDILPNASEVRFLRGRLHFGGAPSAAPFPSMLAIFGPRSARMSPMALTAAERGVPCK